jgi:hypothetical protein
LIKEDLVAIVEILRGNASTPLNKYLKRILDQILDNRVPEEWLLNGFVTHDSSLLGYIKNLLTKKDFLISLVYARKCEMFPIIPLGKMMDPFSLFYDFLWYYAKEHSVKACAYYIEIYLLNHLYYFHTHSAHCLTFSFS